MSATNPAVDMKGLGPDLDKLDDTAQFELGELKLSRNGRFFRYVQFLDAVTYVLGDVVTRGTTGTNVWKVTNDRAGGSAIAGHEVVGVLVNSEGVPTEGQYGWVQVAGECFARGTYAAGNKLIPHASADGEAVVSAVTVAADFPIFAHALSSTRIRLRGLI